MPTAVGTLVGPASLLVVMRARDVVLAAARVGGDGGGHNGHNHGGV